MFSSRLDWRQRPNALAEALSTRRRGGEEILDLTESNPTRAFQTPPSLAVLSDPRAQRYEPDPRGLLPAREAVAAYYGASAHGTSVETGRILLTASTSEAYSYLFHLLCDSGDDVLTPRPSYPLFEYLARLASVNLRQYPLRYDGVWHIDFEALERAIGPRTRAIVVVNPNNPTGSFLKNDELARLETLAANRGLAILSDEVFAEYGFGDDANRVVSLTGERRALTFSMSGLSKLAGLPQMKLGWIVTSGPRADAALDALELIADTFLSVSTPVQVALPELLASSAGMRQSIRERTARNLAAARETFDGSAATVLNTEGGWSAVLQVPSTRSEEQWVLELLDAGVWVQPGYFFDFESEAYLVVSLLTPEAAFAEGLRRLRELL